MRTKDVLKNLKKALQQDYLYNQEELNLLMNDFDKIKFKDSEDDRTFSAKNEKGKVLKRARASFKSFSDLA